MKRFISLIMCTCLVISLCACGSKEVEKNDDKTGNNTVKTVDLDKVYSDCAKVMPEMISLDSDMMLNYCGIKAEDCKKSLVYICGDSLLTDEIWLIEAVDEDALKTISDLADKRLEAKGEESITYSPVQYEVVQKAKIVTVGNYFALLVSPDVDELEKIVNGAFGK
ncbi:MAG: DUF4358 domain-containing protein [Clostridia bacterium]|nr:DUF4358 domain-containing protein [Clostridia bacterium]